MGADVSDRALETSLVEWKLDRRTLPETFPFALETSLVEWKPLTTKNCDWLQLPLETSLVEWKLTREYAHEWEDYALGNFLSGMETWACWS